MDFLKEMDFNILGAVLFFGLLVFQIIQYKKIELNKWIKDLWSAIVIVLTVWLCYLAYLS